MECPRQLESAKDDRSFLPSTHNTIPALQPYVYSQVDVFNLEVDANCGDEGLRERVIRVAQQEARLPHACGVGGREGGRHTATETKQRAYMAHQKKGKARAK